MGLWRAQSQCDTAAVAMCTYSNLRPAHSSKRQKDINGAASLQLDWRAEGEQRQPFTLAFHFGGNATHWFLFQLVLRSLDTTAIALKTSMFSGSAEVLSHGHAIAAPKGLPFECHYLELPLLITNPGSGGAAAAARCASLSKLHAQC